MLFFASQTLHTKCRCAEVNQLPEESLPQLRDSLVNHLSRFGHLMMCNSSSRMMMRPVVNRLALAISALAVQMGWISMVEDVLGMIVNNSSSEDSSSLVRSVMELLMVLPDECRSFRLVVPDERMRDAFFDSMRSVSGVLLDFLGERVSSAGVGGGGGEEEYVMVLNCLRSWVRCAEIPPSKLVQSPLLDWTFGILGRRGQGGGGGGGDASSLFEAGVDAIVEILKTYPSDGHYENMRLVEKMVPLVMGLGDGDGSNCPFGEALRDGDEDCVRGFCRVFTETGEAYMSILVNYQELNQVALVELVLRCTSLPDEEIAEITLHFWSTLASWIESLEPYEYRQLKIDSYTNQLTRLLPIFVQLMKYPQDINLLPNQQPQQHNQQPQQHELDKFRRHVCEAIEDISRLLGGIYVLRHLGQVLKSECDVAVNAMSMSPLERQRQYGGGWWQGMEASLLAIASVADFVSDDEGEVLPFVSDLILQFPQGASDNNAAAAAAAAAAAGAVDDGDVPYLRRTSNLVIGKYSLWLDRHTDKLRPLLPYLARGLNIPLCSSSSAVAIKELCENCSSPHRNDLSLGDAVLDLYDGIVATKQHLLHMQQQQQQQQQTALFIMDVKDEIEVLEGACRVVSRQLACTTNKTVVVTPDIITAYVNRLVGPIGNRLSQLVESAKNNNTIVGAAKAIADELERFTVIIRYLDLPLSNTLPSNNNLSSRATFLTDMLQQSWTVLDAIGPLYPRDVHLAEKLCRFHKHSIRACGPAAYAPSFLESLLTQLVRNFSITPHLSPYLYAASICISEFGRRGTRRRNVGQYSRPLFQMLSEMSSVVFAMMKAHDDFINHPDVVEEFFFLCAKMMMHCPEMLVLSPMLTSLLNFTAVAMMLDHRDANSGILNFLDATISYGLELKRGWTTDNNNSNPETSLRAFEQAITTHGHPIVTNLAGALLGDLPVYRLDGDRGSIAGVLFKLNEFCPALLLGWIDPVLGGGKAPEQAKVAFMNSLSRSDASKDEFYSSVKQFTSICIRNRKLIGGGAF